MNPQKAEFLNVSANSCVLQKTACVLPNNNKLSKIFFRTSTFEAGMKNLATLKAIFNEDTSFFVESLDTCKNNTTQLNESVKTLCKLPPDQAKGNDKGPFLWQSDFPVRGQSLNKLLPGNRAIDILDAFPKVLHGLNKLHTLNWYHNDLFKTNIVFSKHKELLVIDFDNMRRHIVEYARADIRNPPEHGIPSMKNATTDEEGTYEPPVWNNLDDRITKAKDIVNMSTKKFLENVFFSSANVPRILLEKQDSAAVKNKLDAFKLFVEEDLQAPFESFVRDDDQVNYFQREARSTNSKQFHLKASTDMYGLAGIFLVMLVKFKKREIRDDILSQMYYLAKQGLSTNPFKRIRLSYFTRCLQTLLMINSLDDSEKTRFEYYYYFGVTNQAGNLTQNDIPTSGYLSCCNDKMQLPFRDIRKLLSPSADDLHIPDDVVKAYTALAAFTATQLHSVVYSVISLAGDSATLTQSANPIENVNMYYLFKPVGAQRWTLYRRKQVLEIVNVFEGVADADLSPTQHVVCVLCTLLRDMDLIIEFPRIANANVGVEVFCRSLAYQLIHGSVATLHMATNRYFRASEQSSRLYGTLMDLCFCERPGGKKEKRLQDEVLRLYKEALFTTQPVTKEMLAKPRRFFVKNPVPISAELCNAARWEMVYEGFHRNPIGLSNSIGIWCHLNSVVNAIRTAPSWCQFLNGLEPNKDYYTERYRGTNEALKEQRKLESREIVESLKTVALLTPETNLTRPDIDSRMNTISRKLYGLSREQQDVNETLTLLLQSIQSTLVHPERMPSAVNLETTWTCSECGAITRETATENVVFLRTTDGENKSFEQWLMDVQKPEDMEKICSNPACRKYNSGNVKHSQTALYKPLGTTLHIAVIVYINLKDEDGNNYNELMDIQLDTPATLVMDGKTFWATSHVRHSGFKGNMKSGHYVCNSFNATGCMSGNDEVVQEGSLLIGRPVLFTYVRVP